MGKARRNKKRSPAPGEFIILKNMQSSDEETNGKRSVGTATDIQTKSKGNQTDHVVIQMPENVDESLQIEQREQDAGNDIDDIVPEGDEKTPIFLFSFAYMTTHFGFMQRTGMLHVRENDRVFSWKSALHLIAFGVSYMLALIWELGRGKDYMLSRESNKKTSVFYIITIWFYFHTAFVSMFFMKLVIQNSISKFFNNVESIKKKRSKSRKNDEKLSKVSKLTIVLAIINILITVYMASGANLVLFKDYDHEDILIYRTSQFQERLLYWQKSDYSIPLDRANNATELETEHVIYGSAEIGFRLVGSITWQFLL